MPKVQLNVTKLGDPTVNFISLVNRGANRIPFRIVKHDKQESGMIDLASLNISRLFKSEKTDEALPQPSIVGFVTMKDENFDLVKDGLKEAGYLVSKQFEEADGSVVFKQEENLPDEFVVLKMNDSLLALVANLDAEAMVEGTIYESLLKEESFLPSPDIASQGFALAMSEISYGGDTAQDKVAKMEMVTKDYNGYLGKLFSWVPTRLTELARDLESAIAAHSKEKPEATTSELRGEIQNTPSKASDADNQNDGQSAGVNATGTPAPSAFDGEINSGKTDGIPSKVTTKSDETATEEVAKSDDTADLLKKMETMLATMQASILSSTQEAITKQSGELADKIAALDSTVSAVRKSQDSLHDRVVEAEKVAKSADTAVRGKVITSANGEDDASHSTVAKSGQSDEGFGGCIDTAFSTVRKQAIRSPLQRRGNR